MVFETSNSECSFKGQVASISSKSATNFFFDYWRSSSSKPTPFHLGWHQYAHILRTLSLSLSLYLSLSRVGRKTAHSEASHHKNEPLQRFLLVTAASQRFSPPALKVYGLMSVVFGISGTFWIVFLCRHEETVFKIHYLMFVLVLLKTLSLMFHSVSYPELFNTYNIVTWTCCTCYMYYELYRSCSIYSSIKLRPWLQITQWRASTVHS